MKNGPYRPPPTERFHRIVRGHRSTRRARPRFMCRSPRPVRRLRSVRTWSGRRTLIKQMTLALWIGSAILALVLAVLLGVWSGFALTEMRVIGGVP